MIVNSYVYLGINFNYNGKFKVALETISNQATKAIYGIKKVYKYELMDIEIKLQLLDAIVIPILLYRSEEQGFENTSNVGKNTKFAFINNFLVYMVVFRM